MSDIRGLVMKKHIRVVLAAMTLCLLPVLFLSPLLFGAGPNCNLYAFYGPCNYSAGCSLTINQCSSWNTEPGCVNNGSQTSLAVNYFSCSPGRATQACNPVLNGGGIAATTTCTTSYKCMWNGDTNKCVQGAQTGMCVAPYYVTAACN
jgi:hypothetical protein